MNFQSFFFFSSPDQTNPTSLPTSASTPIINSHSNPTYNSYAQPLLNLQPQPNYPLPLTSWNNQLGLSFGNPSSSYFGCFPSFSQMPIPQIPLLQLQSPTTPVPTNESELLGGSRREWEFSEEVVVRRRYRQRRNLERTIRCGMEGCEAKFSSDMAFRNHQRKQHGIRKRE